MEAEDMNIKKKKSIKLSVYLLKQNIDPKNSLKEKYQSKLTDYEQKKEWKIIIDDKVTHKPDWANYLKVPAQVSSASAVLFIKHEQVWFALCFGYGHNMLNTNKLTGDFGLITTLNMLDENKIKSSDIFAPSDRSKQRRTQTVMDSNLQGHDMDGFCHILKKITGKTLAQYEHLSKTISAGYENIQINTSKSVAELEQLCSDIYKIYKKEDYKQNFPEVSHIQPVKDENIKQSLFKQLLNSLNNQDSNIQLEVPDLIDFQTISKFRVNIKDRKKHFMDDLSTERFYEIISNSKKDITMDNLKKRGLVLVDNNDNEKNSFSLLKCLVFDCKLEGNNYHFSHGKWYMLDQAFSAQLENSIAPLKADDIYGKSIPDYNHQNEAEYNKHLAKILEATLLDKNCITMGGYDKIEPCDVFFVSEDNKNIFIHVKIKHGGSSSLSHLFQQGSVSLTLLNRKDQKFIKGIKEKALNFNPALKNVVYYLIISDNQSIPLFAKVSLFKIIEDIKSKNGEIFWSIKEKGNTIKKTKEPTRIKKDRKLYNYPSEPTPSPM